MPNKILTFTNTRLQPAAYPSDARTINGKFGANLTVPAGCVMGRKTSDSLLYPTVTANNVQTATASAAATAGTFTITLLDKNGVFQTTTALAYNASIATIQAALDTASGVANGVVASSAASAAPFSTPTPLILTFSGTGYSAVEQPLVAVDYSALTGATVAVAYQQPNVVQTIKLDAVATAGHFTVEIIRSDGKLGIAGPIAYNASLATLQTALDAASGVANGIVAATGASAAPFSAAGTITLTYSGTGYASQPQSLATLIIGADVTGTASATVDDTTITRDGTEKAVGFSEFGFRTDANGNCYLTTGTPQADLVATPSATMPVFVSGWFNTADLPGWRDAMAAQLSARFINAGLIRIP